MDSGQDHLCHSCFVKSLTGQRSDASAGSEEENTAQEGENALSTDEEISAGGDGPISEPDADDK